jgi:hypothetical protein
MLDRRDDVGGEYAAKRITQRDVLHAERGDPAENSVARLLNAECRGHRY